MGARLDINPGDAFGRWTVIRRAEDTPRGQARYRCRCACGRERAVVATSLTTGRSMSCGCRQASGSSAARMKAVRAARRPEDHPRGDAHYNAKLNAKAVRKARELAARGYTRAEIRDHLGLAICKSTLSNAINRTSWKSVE
jgi:hypothetical protein